MRVERGQSARGCIRARQETRPGRSFSSWSAPAPPLRPLALPQVASEALGRPDAAPQRHLQQPLKLFARDRCCEGGGEGGGEAVVNSRLVREPKAPGAFPSRASSGAAPKTAARPGNRMRAPRRLACLDKCDGVGLRERERERVGEGDGGTGVRPREKVAPRRLGRPGVLSKDVGLALRRWARRLPALRRHCQSPRSGPGCSSGPPPPEHSSCPGADFYKATNPRSERSRSR
jgi:hypothetical protein